MSTERHLVKRASEKEVTNRKRSETKGRTRKGKDILDQIRSAQKEQERNRAVLNKPAAAQPEVQNLKAFLNLIFIAWSATVKLELIKDE